MAESRIRDTRWPMGVGIRAGRALVNAERALFRIQATAVEDDFHCIRTLRDARLELNHLAREISNVIRTLEDARDGA